MYHNNTTGNCLLRTITYYPEVSYGYMNILLYVMCLDINTDNDINQYLMFEVGMVRLLISRGYSIYNINEVHRKTDTLFTGYNLTAAGLEPPNFRS